MSSYTNKRIGGLCLMAGVVAMFPSTAKAMNIIPTYDASMTGNANFTAIKACIDSACNWYNTHLADPITVNFTFHATTSGLGSNNPGTISVGYQTLYNQLAADATTAVDASAIASLPNQANNPVNGSTNMVMARPNARAIGINTVGGTDDTINLNVGLCYYDHVAHPGSTKYDLYSVACHEMNEGLGSPSGINFTSNPWTPDLFRYRAAGVRTWDSNTTHVAYFSPDGGVTNTGTYNQLNRTTGDWADWQVHSPGWVQDWAGTPGEAPEMGPGEMTMLDAIGYTPVPEPATMSVLGLGVLALIRRKRR